MNRRSRIIKVVKYKMSYKSKFKNSAVMLITIVLCSCANIQESSKSVVELTPSYLEHSSDSRDKGDDGYPKGNNKEQSEQSSFVRVDSIASNSERLTSNKDLTARFDDQRLIQIATDELPLNDWLHYVLGDVLQVNYILDNAAKQENKKVTLNIREKMSSRRLFVLVEDLLVQNGFSLNFNDDIFYVTKVNNKENRGEVVYGFGKQIKDVPQTSREVFQIVPLEFGVRTNYNLILSKITSAQLIPDFQQSLYFIRGKRDEIIKALEFFNMVDTPYVQSQHLGMADLRFISPDQLLQNITQLLEREGISVSASSSQGASVAFVPIDHLGAVAIFATSAAALNRVEFWVNQLDKPVEGGESQYFVYQPKLARATDLLDSLGPLLGQGSGFGNSSSTSSSQGQGAGATSSRQPKQTRTKSAMGDDVKVVVDERSNSLIIFSTGEKYQQLLPLLSRMDVMPKQVMLEVLIAEVTLKDEFKHGVEFFLNNGNYTLGNLGSSGDGDSLGLTNIGGLSYIFSGSSKWDVKANLNEQNNLVNILSRPSIVVRDGVTANMQVGTDIPIITSTSSPDVGTTTSIQYRKTGLTLDVTPTVNSQGIVIMEISQQVSNVVEDGLTAEGAPSIFDRSMKTEVVADSGQTVILGGLISENTSNGVKKIPGLGDLPLFGNLFSSKSDVTDKTELVIMVTPRIIDNNNQWQEIKAKFKQSLVHLDF